MSSVNRISLIAPWPQLALALAGQESWALGAFGETHTLSWERDDQLGLTLVATGSSYRAPPLAHSAQLSALAGNCVSLISYVDFALDKEGWAIACEGDAILSSHGAPRQESDEAPTGSKARLAFLEASQSKAILERSRQTDRAMTPFLLALKDSQFPLARSLLESLLKPAQPFAGLALWQAAALMDAPELLRSDELDRSIAAQALALAPLVARPFPIGSTPGGRFLSFAEKLHPGCSQERAQPHQSSASSRLTDLLSVNHRLISVSERQNLLERVLKTPESLRALSEQGAELLIFSAGQSFIFPLAHQARSIALGLVDAGALDEDQLLKLAFRSLEFAQPLALPEPTELWLIDIAARLSSARREALVKPATELGLTHLSSALESCALRELLPQAPPTRHSRL